MGNFKEYFERAKSAGLDETIKVPTFESKQEILDWLNEIAKDVQLDAVIVRDDVYDPITEELLVESGEYLSTLRETLGEGPFEEAYDTELKSARGGWSPLMKEYMRKSSVSPEQRKRQKAGDKAMWEGERKKHESIAQKYLDRFNKVTKDAEEQERDKKREEREYYRNIEDKRRAWRTEFKGMSLPKLIKQYRSMGEDMAGDFMYDLENDMKKGKSADDAKDEFDAWAQSAAGEIYMDSQIKRFLAKVHDIGDPTGWAADEVYEGMRKAFEKRSAQWS